MRSPSTIRGVSAAVSSMSLSMALPRHRRMVGHSFGCARTALRTRSSSHWGRCKAAPGGGHVTGYQTDQGFVTRPMSSADFTTFVADQVKTFQAPVKASGAKL